MKLPEGSRRNKFIKRDFHKTPLLFAFLGLQLCWFQNDSEGRPSLVSLVSLVSRRKPPEVKLPEGRSSSQRKPKDVLFSKQARFPKDVRPSGSG